MTSEFHIDNKGRAARARETIQHYCEQKGHAFDLRTDVQDLLTDIWHLAAQQGWNIFSLVGISRGHYHAEVDGEEQAASPSD